MNVTATAMTSHVKEKRKNNNGEMIDQRSRDRKFLPRAHKQHTQKAAAAAAVSSPTSATMAEAVRHHTVSAGTYIRGEGEGGRGEGEEGARPGRCHVSVID